MTPWEKENLAENRVRGICNTILRWKDQMHPEAYSFLLDYAKNRIEKEIEQDKEEENVRL